MARFILIVPVAVVVAALLAIAANYSRASNAAPPIAGVPADATTPVLPPIAGVLAGWPEAMRLWTSFKGRFVGADGRVVDDGNGGISHSEGQAYTMVLAVAADDPATFARVWGWTRTHLAIRPDRLAAWRWRPRETPHVDDPNNATDADLMMAWALAEAGAAWSRPELTAAARQIADDIIDKLVAPTAHGAVLMPGAAGFAAGERPDGPVINLSYWVFPALIRLQALLPETDWVPIAETGLKLIETARFGPADLPADWIALGGETPAPAGGFTGVFGYDALRVPLYLAWSGLGERHLLAPFMRRWGGDDFRRPAVVDLKSGKPLSPLADAGYRSVAALVHCAMEGRRFPTPLRQAETELYYPTTLRLFTFAALSQRFPECW